jgi:hypothetical protein
MRLRFDCVLLTGLILSSIVGIWFALSPTTPRDDDGKSSNASATPIVYRCAGQTQRIYR